MQQRVMENHTISGYFVFFVIGTSQAAANIFNFQSVIVFHAGQDAWLSIIIMGLSILIITRMVYSMLGNPSKDVIDIHQSMFGKSLGNIISLLLVGYFFLLALFFFRAYMEIILVWVFPTARMWMMAAFFICIFYYVVSGGFRVVAGFCTFYILLTPMLLWLIFPIRQGEIQNLLPLINHSLIELLKGSKASGLIFFGLEALLVYFPFLKKAEKHEKWAHFAVLFTILKYTAIMIVTLMYFSQGLLKHSLWPMLAMTKIVETSFLARFEYLFIFLWQLVIVPTVCILIWCCTRIMKRTISLKPGLTLPIVLLALFVSALMFTERVQITALKEFVNQLGFYFIFIYIPVIFIINRFAVKRVHTHSQS